MPRVCSSTVESHLEADAVMLLHSELTALLSKTAGFKLRRVHLPARIGWHDRRHGGIMYDMHYCHYFSWEASEAAL